MRGMTRKMKERRYLIPDYIKGVNTTRASLDRMPVLPTDEAKRGLRCVSANGYYSEWLIY